MGDPNHAMKDEHAEIIAEAERTAAYFLTLLMCDVSQEAAVSLTGQYIVAFRAKEALAEINRPPKEPWQ